MPLLSAIPSEILSKTTSRQFHSHLLFSTYLPSMKLFPQTNACLLKHVTNSIIFTFQCQAYSAHITYFLMPNNVAFASKRLISIITPILSQISHIPRVYQTRLGDSAGTTIRSVFPPIHTVDDPPPSEPETRRPAIEPHAGTRSHNRPTQSPKPPPKNSLIKDIKEREG